jgi:hypothetical protein
MTGDHALGKAGDLTFRVDEWAVIEPALARGAGWQTVNDDEDEAPDDAR